MASLTWHADGPPQPDGTVGGDGAGESVSVRYRAAEKPGSLITAYWYTVDLRMRSDDQDDEYPWDVEEMVEYLVCDDPDEPGSTEIWSDYKYDNPLGLSFKTEAEAIVARDAAARRDQAENYLWDGEPHV